MLERNLLILCLGLLVNFSWMLQLEVYASSSLVAAPVSSVHLPQGFDDNDIVQILVEGVFPNPCYRAGDAKVGVNHHDSYIVFYLQAHRYESEQCSQVRTPFLKPIDIGKLKAGRNYRVYQAADTDGSKLRPRGEVSVQKARSTSRDEFLYAPIDSAVVIEDQWGQRRDLLLIGTFTNSCMRFDPDPPVRSTVRHTQERLIEILPILEDIDEGMNCAQMNKPFMKRIPIPDNIPKGRYAFHIRRMDGESFNKLDSIDAR